MDNDASGVSVFYCNGVNEQQAVLPAGTSTYASLVAFIRRTFSTAGQQERINFNPHPKTLTMAGDYEYFAAQGQHPLAFALAELVDNSLRATKANKQQPRSITVSLVTDDKAQHGMVCVRDNGSGMNVQELSNWAVMNLSMEDKGLLKKEEGKVKVVTKPHESTYVHELSIQAAELERRYCEGEVVYEEDMLHRLPGDASSILACEEGFPLAAVLLQQEVVEGESATCPVSNTDACSSSNASFTRVMVHDLKPDVLEQLLDRDNGQSILRDLAHLYHYYLHGAQGNTFTKSRASQLPNGERIPDIVVERLVGTGVAWRKLLVEVDDDLESCYLAAHRDKMEFVLSVPNHGRVEGVLWYFPFENDRETVPLDPHTLGRMMLTGHKEGATQAAGVHGGFTQIGPSQLAGLSQRATQARGKQADLDEEQDAGYAALLAACPTFEAFWQGRLIPGACVDSLPFIRSIQARRNAAAKDKLPDEVFSRIRGALFFGPGFRVTRNKLTFRDNLALLLETASPQDRQLEKHFKEWLIKCHSQLDRSVRFEVLCHQAAQAVARKHLGQEFTIFEQVHDGINTVQKGDIIRINTKPAVLGRVMHFSIPQVVQCEGCYSGGRVTVAALPEELLGPNNLHTWPLRRVEGKVDDEELREHINRELMKLPASLHFEPMKLSAGGLVVLPAGSFLPETSISVLNGASSKITKAFLAGKREQLKVVQSLYYLGAAGRGAKRTAAAANLGSTGVDPTTLPPSAAGEEIKGGGKKTGSRKGKRRKKGSSVDADEDAIGKENEQPAVVYGAVDALAQGAAKVQVDEPVPEGELLLAVENKTPKQDCFVFQRITGGLNRSGYYCLQYSLLPELPNCTTLRLSIELQITPGPAAAFNIRGEGRAIALSKSIMLGETLPQLRVQLQDSYGNTVAPVAEDGTQLQLSLQVLHEGGLAAGAAVVDELQALAEVDVDQDELLLNSFRVTGPTAPGPGSHGLKLFRPKAALAGGTSTASSQHCRAAPAPAVAVPIVRAADVFLAAHLAGMAPQGFPIRLMPGAPHALRLLAGHPFCQAAEDADASHVLTQLAAEHLLQPAEVMNGEELPAFKVQAIDAWGNATCPTEGLQFEVALQCGAADPSQTSFTVDDRGVSNIRQVPILRQPTTTVSSSQEGTPQQQEQPYAPQPHQLLLWPHLNDCQQPAMQHALDLARPQQQLVLPLLVQPSTQAAELLMTYNGEELERRMQEGDNGPEVVWQLSGVEAGSRVEGLAVRCTDEVGRPAVGGVRGKFKVSWANGSKKATLCGDDIRLPSLPAPDTVGEAVPYWIRFIGDEKEWPGVSFDIQLEVSVAPGPPASWSVALVDYADGAAVAVARQDPGGADLSSIACGQPFYLEVEALDACHNRYEDRPTPVVQAEPEDKDAQLQLEPDAWQYKWDKTQQGGDVCMYKMWLAGPPGPVKLIVMDKDGEDGACLLAPDELPVELLPGPAAALVADCCQQLECGTRGQLEALPVKVVDSFGNLCESASFEVSLNGSAFNGDGVAARVAAAGSNRAKLRNGIAVFKNVRIAAPSEGPYKLTIGSVSRKVAVQEAVVSVMVAQQNYVVNLEVMPASLPAAGNSTVGRVLQLLVALETENLQPVPWDVISSSLALALAPPFPGSALESTAGAAAGGGWGSKANGRKGSAKGSAPRKADVLSLVPDKLFDAQQVQLDGWAPELLQAAAVAASRGCVVVFNSPELLVAGQYTVTAEYTENRPQLLPGLSKQEQSLRSTSAQFELSSGPVSTAVLQAAGADQEEFTISNGKDAAQRRLLRNAVVQLLDAHQNAAALPGVAVRWRLLLGDSGSRADEATAPQLCCSSGEVQLNSDDNGRAFFGDVAVEQDTGRMPAGAGQAVPCSLEVQVLLPRGKSKRGSSSSGGSAGSNWVTVWQRAVLFCDDSARIKKLQALQEQQKQVQQQLGEVKQNIQEVQQQLERAQQEHKAASRVTDAKLNQLRQALNQPDLQLPTSSKEARQLIEQVKMRAAQQPDRLVLTARYGSPKHPMTAAITKLLQHSDPDAVGVFAQLAYVDNPRLSEVLAANYCSAMQVLVVKTYEAINRLRAAAQKANAPVPSMLSYTLIQEFSEGTECGSNIQMVNMSPLAHQLLADACHGSDAPLPIPLPHTRQITLMQMRGVQPPAGLAANQWPPGCLGYAVNLMRPLISHSRKGLLYAQVGRTMVFESIDQAAQYRHYVIKELRGSVGDIVTLDKGKLSGRGVVLGSTFKVCGIDEAPFRSADAQSPAQQQQQQQQLEVIEVLDEAAPAHAAADAPPDARQQRSKRRRV
eukprot:gene2831-3124_t